LVGVVLMQEADPETPSSDVRKGATMFTKILLAVDGSEHSVRAAEAAAGIAKGADASIEVIHVHEVGLFAPLESPREADELVDGVVQELLANGVKAAGDVVVARTGSIVPAILDVAKVTEADLIVMGTRGLSDFSGLLVGSVAHKLIHHAGCPVLVVR
jgi:nucleotide-binding universal stress UspA family protein